MQPIAFSRRLRVVRFKCLSLSLLAAAGMFSAGTHSALAESGADSQLCLSDLGVCVPIWSHGGAETAPQLSAGGPACTVEYFGTTNCPGCDSYLPAAAGAATGFSLPFQQYQFWNSSQRSLFRDRAVTIFPTVIVWKKAPAGGAAEQVYREEGGGRLDNLLNALNSNCRAASGATARVSAAASSTPIWAPTAAQPADASPSPVSTPVSAPTQYFSPSPTPTPIASEPRPSPYPSGEPETVAPKPAPLPFDQQCVASGGTYTSGAPAGFGACWCLNQSYPPYAYRCSGGILIPNY